MRAINQIADSELKNADFIAAVDPSSYRFVTIYGDDCLARGRAPGAPAYQSKIVDIECAASDALQLDEIVRRVQSAKGSVSSRLTMPAEFRRAGV